MPYMDVKLAQKVSCAEKETLKAAFGKAIATLNKSETYLMVGIEDEKDLWLGGEKLEKGAFVAVSLLGDAGSAAYNEMTAAVCRILEEQLGIPGTGVYVAYSPLQHWGWNGSNF